MLLYASLRTTQPEVQNGRSKSRYFNRLRDFSTATAEETFQRPVYYEYGKLYEKTS
jgi:hypothetical protein